MSIASKDLAERQNQLQGALEPIAASVVVWHAIADWTDALESCRMVTWCNRSTIGQAEKYVPKIYWFMARENVSEKSGLKFRLAIRK